MKKLLFLSLFFMSSSVFASSGKYYCVSASSKRNCSLSQNDLCTTGSFRPVTGWLWPTVGACFINDTEYDKKIDGYTYNCPDDTVFNPKTLTCDAKPTEECKKGETSAVATSCGSGFSVGSCAVTSTDGVTMGPDESGLYYGTFVFTGSKANCSGTGEGGSGGEGSENGGSDGGNGSENGGSGENGGTEGGNVSGSGSGGGGSGPGSGNGEGEGNGSGNGNGNGNGSGNGEGEGENGSPYGGKFDKGKPDGFGDGYESDWDKKIEDVRNDITKETDKLYDKFKDKFVTHLPEGGGSLPCYKFSIPFRGLPIEICLADYADQLSVIRAAVILSATVVAAFMILG